MKRQFFVLIFVSCIFTGSAFAGSGKAIVPTFMVEAISGQTTDITVVNITGNPVDVTITVYKGDGTLMTSGITFENFTGSQLDGKEAGIIHITAPTWTWGYAIIEWANQGSDDNPFALIAQGRYNRIITGTAEASMSIPINRGQAF